ncbi:hypothetical protein KSD_89760 [Ktedonobacter sp. SOSP1-85]|uniref:ABC transporter permease n=1 Tax=Ktedonobacter sp. SOSP1-85 TaxID=2778367 RepID=UPI001914E6F5|nr:ABC transporter permease [Ktedonobacter sp. SOSP1-85]GHO81205.1 hypothetical protein KSD_89760 [Ktedonobacter sp. SOSP1-85]
MSQNIQPPQTLPGERRAPSLLTQFLDVFLIELTNWRWSWRSLITLGMISPLLSTTALGTFARDSGSLSLSYVLVGNIVLALLFNNMNNVNGHVFFMREHGTLDYFATLPVRRYILIVAILAAFLLLSLPSLLVTIIGGTLILGVHLQISPLLLIVLPLCTLPFSAIGALIGARMSTPETANAFSYILTLVLLALGPVVIPPDHLPPLLIFIGRFSPATYAASALRQVLLGPITSQLLIDIGVMAGLTIIAFWFVNRKLDWSA